MPKYEQYNTNTPDLTEFEAWGHFTQLVWKKTLSVGCYTEICSPPVADPLDCKADGTSWLKKVKCGKGGTPAIFTVCDYYPQGKASSY